MGAGGDRVKSGGSQGSEESGHLLMVFCLKDLIFMCINVWDAYMCVYINMHMYICIHMYSYT